MGNSGISKKTMNSEMGVGGVHCDCCNWTHCHNGRNQAKTQLRKKIRTKLKEMQSQEERDYFED